MEMTRNSKDLSQYAEDKLRIHFEEDNQFLQELAFLVTFYSNKFYQFLNNEDELRKEFDDSFFEVAKSQIFQGYYLMVEIINDPETSLGEEFFSLPDGYIKEEVPVMLKEALGDSFDQLRKTEAAQKFSMWLITRYENIYDIVNQTLFDLLCTGAFQALIDERDKLHIKPDNMDKVELLLGNPSSLNFINPQIFMTATGVNDNFEIWDLRWWSSYNNLEKAGGVTVLTVNNNNVKNYMLNIEVHQTIHPSEREQVVEYLALRLTSNNDIPISDIQINLAVVEDYSILSM
jgi:hypothetical protein